jgi:hypothetical protein
VFAVEGSDFGRFRQQLAAGLATAPAASMLHADIRQNFEKHRDALLAVPGCDVFVRATAVADRSKTQASPLCAVTDAATCGAARFAVCSGQVTNGDG